MDGFDYKHYLQEELGQFLQVLSLLSPYFPSGQGSKHLLSEISL